MRVVLGILAGLAALVFVVMISTGLTVFGLHFDRWAMPFAEETRRQTYTTSMSYQQGNQQDFENLCMNYAHETDQESRDLIKSTAQHRLSVYVGPSLSFSVRECLAKMGVQ